MTLPTSVHAQSEPTDDLAPDPTTELVPLPDPIPSVPGDVTPPLSSFGLVQEVLDEDADLPEPVARMKALIEDAARSGDFERLRPLLGQGKGGTQVSVTETTGDPVTHLKSNSGDPDGHEVLAILLDILALPPVRLTGQTESGTEALFVWPYFVAKDLSSLTSRERVQLFSVVTAGDLDAMLAFGAYNFFRTGITEDGHWAFFLVGD